MKILTGATFFQNFRGIYNIFVINFDESVFASFAPEKQIKFTSVDNLNEQVGQKTLLRKHN
jgi:hypothetical protein